MLITSHEEAVINFMTLLKDLSSFKNIPCNDENTRILLKIFSQQ
jgi:hypothetical protein